MQPDCRRHLPDDFAAFPPDGDADNFAAGNVAPCTIPGLSVLPPPIKKYILKLNLPSAPRSFIAPKGIFFFFFHF